jgi:hypothetical protein
MSVIDGYHDVGKIDPLDSAKALAHVCQYILLHISALDVNQEGESQWLNTLLVSASNQRASVLTDEAKRYLMGMVASVEHSLRYVVEKAKSYSPESE